MANVAGRYRIREETEQALLRREYFELYRAEKRYQNIINLDLRPASDPIFSEYDRRRFFLLPGKLVRGDVRIADDRYQAYIDLLRERATQLHMTYGGSPVEWAMQAIHGDVVTTSVGILAMWASPRKRVTVLASEDLELSIDIRWPKASIHRRSINRPSEDDNTRWVYALEPTPQWDDLEEAAVQMVRDWFMEARARVEASIPQRNRSSFTSRTNDIKTIFRHVYFGDPVDPSRNKTLSRIASLIEIDFPRR